VYRRAGYSRRATAAPQQKKLGPSPAAKLVKNYNVALCVTV